MRLELMSFCHSIPCPHQELGCELCEVPLLPLRRQWKKQEAPCLLAGVSYPLLTAAALQPLELGLRGWGLLPATGKETPGAFHGLRATWASVPGAAGLSPWGCVGAAGISSSPQSSGLLLLTHLCVHGECASAQSLQADGLNIISLWFSRPDMCPATEAWLGEGAA